MNIYISIFKHYNISHVSFWNFFYSIINIYNISLHLTIPILITIQHYRYDTMRSDFATSRALCWQVIDYRIWKPSKIWGDKTFTNKGAQLWNTLHKSIKNIIKIQQFTASNIYPVYTEQKYGIAIQIAIPILNKSCRVNTWSRSRYPKIRSHFRGGSRSGSQSRSWKNVPCKRFWYDMIWINIYTRKK